MIFVAPKEHPHSTAADHIPYEHAIDSARVFAQRSGFMQLSDAEAKASIRYDGKLLNELQMQHGRGEAIRMAREAGVPAYYWEIKWTRRTDDETEALGWTRVTLEGRPLAMHIEAAAVPRQAYHAGALAELFDSPVPVDSLPPNRLAFRLDAPVRESPLRAEQLQADRVFLDRSDAERLAKYHLQVGPFADRAAHVDSVFASYSGGLVMATIRVSNADDAPGRFFSADIEVMPGGTLVSLEPKFVPEIDAQKDSVDVDDIRRIPLFVAALLAIILVVVFFRRWSARVVDTKAAIRDGFIAAVAAAIAISTQLMIDGSSAVDILGLVPGVGLFAISGGILIYFVSGAALSVARERWDDKLQTLALVRSLNVRNVPVGSALLRGISAGLALTGLILLLMVLFDGVWLHFFDSGDAFFGDFFSTMVKAVRNVAGTFFWAIYLTLGAVVGIGALFLRKQGSGLWAFVAVVGAFALLQIFPWNLRPLPMEYVMSGVYGAAVAAVFWRFDALTTLTTLFVFVVSAPLVPNWSVPATPEFTASVYVISVVGLLAVVGVVGVMSAKHGSEVPVIIPEYIRELAQQERIKRELELAREVQLSFLPAKPPEVLGLDLASVCLPAYEVGGDYYDFFRMQGERLGVVVGDVSGKGMQAAFYVTLIKGILQCLNASLTRPAAILSGANEFFRMNAPRGMFMSIALGVIDRDNRTWTCARAGHNPMLIHRKGTDYPEEVKPRGAAIGLVSDPLFSGNIEEAIIPLAPGDLLLVYTDGITEAMNRDRELYDERRLEEAVARARGLSASEVIASIIADVEEFKGDAPRHDDMTMVAIRILDHERV